MGQRIEPGSQAFYQFTTLAGEEWILWVQCPHCENLLMHAQVYERDLDHVPVKCANCGMYAYRDNIDYIWELKVK